MNQTQIQQDLHIHLPVHQYGPRVSHFCKICRGKHTNFKFCDVLPLHHGDGLSSYCCHSSYQNHLNPQSHWLDNLGHLKYSTSIDL